MALSIEERMAKREEDARNFRIMFDMHEKTSDRRFNEVKEDIKGLQNLATYIERLATNMEHMQKSQTEILDRLDQIEKAPVDDARYYKRTAIACVITSVLTALVSAGVAILNNI